MGPRKQATGSKIVQQQTENNGRDLEAKVWQLQLVTFFRSAIRAGLCVGLGAAPEVKPEK